MRKKIDKTNKVGFAITIDARGLDDETSKRVKLSKVRIETKGGWLPPEMAKRFLDLLSEADGLTPPVK